MQTPEKISLIGGGILLSSGLILGLHSSASSILPKISHPVYEMTASDKQKQQDAHNDWWNGLSNFDKGYNTAQQNGWKTGMWGSSKYYLNNQNILYVGNGQVQGNLADLLGNESNNIKDVKFDNNAQHSSDNLMNANDVNHKKQQAFENSFEGKYQQAQQKGWQIGQWGTAKFYVDDQGNMYVGGGQLNGSFSKVVNDQQIKTINLDESTQAPQGIQRHLFADSNYNSIPLKQINGLSNLNTSQTTSMGEMFENDSSLNNIDLSHFDTSNVNDMVGMFYGDSSLSNLDLSHFDTHNVNDMDEMFFSDSSLSSIDLSHFDTHNVTNMDDMFEYDNIHQLSLGKNINLQNTTNDLNYYAGLTGTYQNNGQTLNLDGNAHPGTWIKQ